MHLPMNAADCLARIRTSAALLVLLMTGLAAPGAAESRELSGSQPPAPLRSDNWMLVRSASEKVLVNEPIQFGRPFRKGEVRGCPQLEVDGRWVPAQVDVKSRYADGSVRFAIVSVVLSSVPARPSLALTLADGPCAEAKALSPEEMLGERFDFDATVTLDGGASGTASARELIRRGKYRIWTQGPVATTVIVTDHDGNSADLGSGERPIRPVFEVQFWPSINATRVRFVLESADTEKLAEQRYGVSLGTGYRSHTERYSHSSVRQPAMTRWTRTFWQGRDTQQLDFDFNVAYLASTSAIPNYDPSIHLDSRARAGIVDAWKRAKRGPFESGFWETRMPTAGGRPDIGPYPRWMVAWLYDGSAEMREVALGLADLAGAWPMHLREGNPRKFVDRSRSKSARGLPVSGYARPTLSMLDLRYPYTRPEDRVRVLVPNSGDAWIPDNAHQPQPFFLPYLLTGEHFYKEQLQFWSGFVLLDDSWGLYGAYCYSKNADPSHLGMGGEVRGIAWAMRMLAEAAWATPDQEVAYKSYLRDAYEDVVTRFEGARGVVRGGNTERVDWKWALDKGDCSQGRLRKQNPLRYWTEGNEGYGSTATVKRFDAPWMYSFVMYSLNRGVELGLPAGGLKRWFAPFFIGQALSPGADPYRLGDYTFPVIDARTQTFFQEWSTVAAQPTRYKGAAEWPPAAPPNSNSTSDLDQGYGTVALAALASAHGEENSTAAWQRFAQQHYAAWKWELDPKWAILPREGASGTTSVRNSSTRETASRRALAGDGEVARATEQTDAVESRVELPAWISRKPLFEWFQLPGTRLSESDAWKSYKPAPGWSGQVGILAYSGAAVKEQGSELFVAGGGHADYAGNEIFSIALGSESPRWKRRIDPSVAPPLPEKGVSHYPDGRPSARHTYWSLQFDNKRNVLLFVGAPALWSKVANSANTMDGFDVSRNEYLPPGSFPSQGGIADYASGIAMDGSGNIYVHAVAGSMSLWLHDENRWLSLGDRGVYAIETPYAIDTRRNRMLRMPNGAVGAAMFDLNRRAAVRPVTLAGEKSRVANGPGTLVYDRHNDVYWYWKWNDNTLYRVDADSLEVGAQIVTGPLPPNNVENGLHQYFGRFAYLPELRALVFMRDTDSALFFLRTSK